MTIDLNSFLEIFPTLRNSRIELIHSILQASTRESFNSKAFLYNEGDKCNGIGLFLKGEVRVFKLGESGREITLYDMFPGDTCILNASSILSDSFYPANAQCVTDVTLLLLPKYDFLELIAGYEEMRSFIFDLLSRRLATIIEIVEEVAFGKLDARLKDFLIEKADNDIVNLTHQQIANDLGSSREVISRLLKDFEKKGHVILSRKKIKLHLS